MPVPDQASLADPLSPGSFSMSTPVKTTFADALAVPGLAQACMRVLLPSRSKASVLSDTHASLRVMCLLCRGSRDAMHKLVQGYTLELTDSESGQDPLDPKLLGFSNKCRLLSFHITVPSITASAGTAGERVYRPCQQESTLDTSPCIYASLYVDTC